MGQVTEVIDAISQRACEAMFPGSFKRREADDDARPDPGLIAVIGFSGDTMRGALGVTAPSPAIAALHPLASARELAEDDLEDWLAELANQLLGRIKGELLDHGVTLWTAAPVLLRGISLRIASRSYEGLRAYSFVGAAGRLVVWIDFKFPADLTLERLPADRQHHHNPGELLLL